MKNILKLTLAGLVLCFLINLPAHADGGNKRSRGDWGINRRVLTPDGYAEVSGDFSMSFSVPLGVAGSADDWDKNRDSPTFYLGGHGNYVTAGEVEVDAGLQYDALPDKGRKRGMWCFVRNSNPDTSGKSLDQYCSLQYYDEVLHKSVVWTSGLNLYGSDAVTSFEPLSYAASLSYRIDETSGIVSLEYDGLGATQPAVGGESGVYIGSGRIYWAAPDSTSAVYNALQADVTHGSTQIVVTPNNSFEDLTVGTILTIGEVGDSTSEKSRIIAVDKANHTLTLSSALAFDHNEFTKISWQMIAREAHSSANRAPWAGSPTFNISAKQTWSVKRVVGMTRISGGNGDPFDRKMTFSSKLDGAWMESVFTDGKVRKVGESNLHGWGANDVDQSTHADLNDTGYDARSNPANPQDAELRQNPALIYDQRISTRAHPMPPESGGEKSDQSKTIVQFPSLNVAQDVARGNSVQSQQAKDSATGESRYTRETVVINLRKLATVKVAPISPIK